MFKFFKRLFRKLVKSQSTDCPHKHFNGEYYPECGGLPNVTGRPLKMSKSSPVVNKLDIRYYFHNPRLTYTPEELLSSPIIVPFKKGIYGWYFDEIPPYIKGGSFFSKGHWSLLYIGITGQDDISKSNLYKRIIEQHLKEDSYASTLRTTLGSLLLEELNLTPFKKGDETSKGFWFGKDEAKLQEWIIKHAKVAFQEHEYPWQIEEEILDTYGNALPFNIKNNPYNPFSEILSQQRKKCLDIAWK